MKYIVFTLVFISSVVSAETLITDNFTIRIEHMCEEGEVTCNTIKFIYSPIDVNKKETIMGKTMHTLCADGITPCRFQGYQFFADGAKYLIYNSGVLEVMDSEGNQLLVEQGTWQY